MIRTFFSRDRISNFELFDRHADQIIMKMKERLNKDGVPVDARDALPRFTPDTAMAPLFGKDVKTLSGDLPYSSTCNEYSPCKPPSNQFAFAQAKEHTFPRVTQILFTGRVLGGHISKH